MSDVVQSEEKWSFSFTIVSFVEKLIVPSKCISSKGGFFIAMISPRKELSIQGGRTRKLRKQLIVNEMMKYDQGGELSMQGGGLGSSGTDRLTKE